MQQLKFFPDKTRLVHGGTLAQKSQRKLERTLSNKRPIHLVLKANPEHNLRQNKILIEKLSNRYASQNKITIYSSSVQKDHIHYCLKIECKESYKKFIRSLTGILSRKLGKGLWKHPPYTRIGSWGRDFNGIKRYILQNELEARGLIPYQPRKK